MSTQLNLNSSEIRNQKKKKKKAINLSPIQINFQPAQDLVFWA